MKKLLTIALALVLVMSVATASALTLKLSEPVVGFNNRHRFDKNGCTA